jgi:hypothetical protein
MRREFSALAVFTGKDFEFLNPGLVVEEIKHLFGAGQEIDVTFAEPTRSRTSKQNRFLHGPVLSAFKSLGYTKQEAKDMLALRFIPREVKQLDGSIVVVPGHTSDLTVEEFVEFIESCIQLAAENDLYIQDAEEWRTAQRKRHAA